MRDIKPQGVPNAPERREPPGELPPEVKRLYEKHARLSATGDMDARRVQSRDPDSIQPARTVQPFTKKPRFDGSKVPVANVHVPKEEEKKPAPSPTPPVIKKTPPVKKKSPMRLGQKERSIVAVLFVIVVIMAGLAAFLFLPKADITLVLKTAPLLIDQDVIIAENTAAYAGAMTGTVFEREVKVEGSSEVTSTEMVGTKATGTVTLVNNTVDEQQIKSASRLVTKDGVLFYMKKHAIIPAQSRVDVVVEAADAGLAGNIAAQRLTFPALDASSQTILYAENAAPFTSGTGEEMQVVKVVDLEQAQLQAATLARGQVESQILDELSEGWVLLDESWSADTLGFETTAAVDERLPAIDYSARMLVHVMGYESSALEKRLKDALTENIDDDYMLFPGSISFTKTVNETNWEDAMTTLTVRVTHTTIASFSIDTLKEKLAGRDKEEAENYLQGLEGAQSAAIGLWPFWVGNIPRIKNRINIEFVSDRQP